MEWTKGKRKGGSKERGGGGKEGGRQGKGGKKKGNLQEGEEGVRKGKGESGEREKGRESLNNTQLQPVVLNHETQQDLSLL